MGDGDHPPRSIEVLEGGVLARPWSRPYHQAILTIRGWSGVAMALLVGCNITAVTFTPAVDDAVTAQDSVDAALGTEAAPALSCLQVKESLGPVSGVYWLRDDVSQPAFQAYCEQELEGGGWAVVYNSVLRLDGATTAFWNISYADRFATLGAPSISDNYYAGSMYVRGTSFLDVITDLDGKDAVAMRAESPLGIDPQTMVFRSPEQVSGSSSVFQNQFAAGWSSPDFDGDRYAPSNCATFYSNVTQHYGACWAYNLGSDADAPFLDGGVGPHVHMANLVELGLQPAANNGVYSRVKRITRYVRW